MISRRERETFGYNASGIRVSSKLEPDADLNGVYEAGTTTNYLLDTQQPSGLPEVLRETTLNSSGTQVKRVDYVLGHSRIAQTVYDTANPNGQTLVFHKDGHNSTRLLADTAGVIQQQFVYEAFGQLVAILNATGTITTGGGGAAGLANASLALTTFQFGDGQFDPSTNLFYHNARWRQGDRFLTLDPVFGNHHDPQSFHKYLYTPGDPVNYRDPDGREFTLTGSMMAGSVRNVITSAYTGAAVGIQVSFNSVQEGLSLNQALFGFVLDTILEPINDVVDTVGAFLDFGQFILEGGAGLVKRLSALVSGSDQSNTVQGGSPIQKAGIPAPIAIGSALIHWYNSKKTLMTSKMYSAVFGPNTQSNHINQYAAFRDAWQKSGRSRGQALAITLDGHASAEGSEHNKFHRVLDDFFESREKLGFWTVDQYNQALGKAAQAAGLSRSEAGRVVAAAKIEQRSVGLSGTTAMYTIPKRVTRR